MAASYSDLINVPSFGKKRESTFHENRGEVSFWCKDCRKIVDAVKLPPEKVGKKLKEYIYQCPICEGRNIAIGTHSGLLEHYEKK